MISLLSTPGRLARIRQSDKAAPWAGLLIVFLTLIAYHNSGSGPFIFDDASSIISNPTIRHLWPLTQPLQPPRAPVTVQGRPVLNLSLAINHAVGGTAVRGYHRLNVVIHGASALALFGLARRTLRRAGPAWRERATSLAFFIAALWAVHPLQTEAVTYVIQRAESLMGMFYFLTLYALVRGDESPRPVWWHALSVLACLLGMATKEVMVSAPLMALFYDRAFIAGSFTAAWRRRKALYLGLAATWFLLGYLVLSTGSNRGGSAGFGVGVAWWDYVLTQFQAVGVYLWLAVRPWPLVFEYGTFWIDRWTDVWPIMLVVVGLALAGVGAFWRNRAEGFLICFFFAILSVTSLVPGTTQMIVEHRMYLPLAPLIAGAVLALHGLVGARSRWVCAALGISWVLLTVARNEDYRSEITIWSDTVRKRPENPLAHELHAQALDRAGNRSEAIAEHRRALALSPNFALAHDNLGEDLARAGRNAEAIAEYEAALRLQPDFADAHNNLGTALATTGRLAEAVTHFEEAVRNSPDFVDAHYNLANALSALGRAPEASTHYQRALALRPEFFECDYNLANLLASTGRAAEAIQYYEAAVRLRPGHSRAHYNLANTLAASGRLPDAISHYRTAVTLEPGFVDAQCNLGTALWQAGEVESAMVAYETALHLKPDAPDVRAMLARLRASRDAASAPPRP